MNGSCSSFSTKLRNNKDFENDTNSVIYMKKKALSLFRENCTNTQCDLYQDLNCTNGKCLCAIENK